MLRDQCCSARICSGIRGVAAYVGIEFRNARWQRISTPLNILPFVSVRKYGCNCCVIRKSLAALKWRVFCVHLRTECLLPLGAGEARTHSAIRHQVVAVARVRDPHVSRGMTDCELRMCLHDRGRRGDATGSEHRDVAVGNRYRVAEIGPLQVLVSAARLASLAKRWLSTDSAPAIRFCRRYRAGRCARPCRSRCAVSYPPHAYRTAAGSCPTAR